MAVKKSKKDEHVWKFDGAHKKPIYYLGLISAMFNLVTLVIAIVLYFSDRDNKAYKNERIIGAKHMRTNLQKLCYVYGWIVLVCIVPIVLLAVLAMGFFYAGFSNLP